MRSARPRQASRTKALILPANWRGRRRPRRQSPSPGSADPSAPGKAHLVGAVLVASDDAHPSAPGRRLRPPPAHGGKRPRSQPPHVPAVFSQMARAVCPASGRSASAQGTITIVPAEKDVSAPSSFRSAPGGDSAYSALSRASSAPPGRRWLQWLRKSRSRRRAGVMVAAFRKSRPAVGQGRCRGVSEKPFAPSDRGAPSPGAAHAAGASAQRMLCAGGREWLSLLRYSGVRLIRRLPRVVSVSGVDQHGHA